jgi:hypothetical protein
VKSEESIELKSYDAHHLFHSAHVTPADTSAATIAAVQTLINDIHLHEHAADARRILILATDAKKLAGTIVEDGDSQHEQDEGSDEVLHQLKMSMIRSMDDNVNWLISSVYVQSKRLPMISFFNVCSGSNC